MTEQLPPDTESGGGWSPPLWVILLALAVLVFAVFVGVGVFRALSGLIFPPSPPLPDSVTAVEHENLAHGRDLWRYESALNPCELVAFYEQQNSTCTLSVPSTCDGTTYNSLDYSVESFATCTGQGTYSIYGLRWELTVDVAWSREGETTYFDLMRETLWSGPPPVATSTPPG